MSTPKETVLGITFYKPKGSDECVCGVGSTTIRLTHDVDTYLTKVKHLGGREFTARRSTKRSTALTQFENIVGQVVLKKVVVRGKPGEVDVS